MKKNFKLIKIKRIETTKEGCEMCDLEVPKLHNFILENGIVTHNSANIDVNALRQCDYLMLKPSSLLQRDFERKRIREIYDEVENDFVELKDNIGLTYIYSDAFVGFVSNDLPSFWNERVSKAYSGNKLGEKK